MEGHDNLTDEDLKNYAILILESYWPGVTRNNRDLITPTIVSFALFLDRENREGKKYEKLAEEMFMIGINPANFLTFKRFRTALTISLIKYIIDRLKNETSPTIALVQKLKWKSVVTAYFQFGQEWPRGWIDSFKTESPLLE